MADNNNAKTFTFNSLPEDLASLKALPEAALTDPFATAALTVAALCVYPKDPDKCIEMLDFLKGPETISTYEKQFLKDRFRGKDYIPRSYFSGAIPDNDYTPSLPYTITISEAPSYRSGDYMAVYLTSGGADSPRLIKLRCKPSTRQWFLSEQMIMVGIREPKSRNPWA